jgi:hypothetical protein
MSLASRDPDPVLESGSEIESEAASFDAQVAAPGFESLGQRDSTDPAFE